MQQTHGRHSAEPHHSNARSARRTLQLAPVALALHALCVGLVTVASATLPRPAWAQVAGVSKEFNIPAGPLEGALNRLGRDAGVLITFGSGVTEGLNSPGVQGSYAVEEALSQVLKGTGLGAIRAAGGGYALRPLPQSAAKTDPSDAARTMPSVTVTAQAERNATTEGTGSFVASGPSATATPLALGLMETPQSVTVVTRQRLDDQKLDSVIDALEVTTGVTAFRQGMGTDLDGLWSRGFTISNYLLDGLPSSFASVAGSRQNTAMFDRVEVVRGASGLMSGMGNPSASINLVRKRPTAERQIILSAEAGSWNRYGLGADISAPLNENGNLRARLVVDSKQQNSWIDRYKKKGDLVYGIAEMDLAPSTLLTAGFSHQTDNNDAPLRTGLPLRYSNGVLTSFDRSTNIAPNWSYYNSELNTVFAGMKHDFDGGWTAKLDVTHSQYKYDGALYFMTGSIDQTTGLGGVLWPVRWQSEDRQNSLDAQLKGTFSLWGQEHDLVTGLALSELRMDTPGYGGWMGPWTGYDGTMGDLRTWNGSSNVPTFVKASDTVTKEHQYSAYLTSRFRLGEATSLIAGARAIDWKRVAETNTTAGAYSQAQARERGVVVPYAGLVHALDETWSLYGSYTKIFNPQGSSVRDSNNNMLDPEEGRSFEAGVKAGLDDGKLIASLALFKTQQDNLAVYNASSNAYEALQGIKSQGLELEVLGEVAKGWNLSAGYAYTSSKDRTGQRANTPIPRHGAKLFSTYRLQGDLNALTVGGGVNWQSEYGYVGEPAQKSYAIVNLMARYALSKQLTVSLNLNNLFDKHYYSGLSNYGGVYGAPRNVMATLKYQH